MKLLLALGTVAGIWGILLGVFHPPKYTLLVQGDRLAATDEETSITAGKTQVDGPPASLKGSDQCLPWLREQVRGYSHYELICSEAAWRAEAQEFQITEKFEAPAKFSRRVLFWYRVYSLFDPKDYIIHLADFPEVILEVIHDPRTSVEFNAGPRFRQHIRQRRAHYSKLLADMDRLPKEQWNAQMHRIAGLMSHISNPKKYRKASTNVRAQRGQREYVQRGIEAASEYMPWIEKEFLDRSLPPELARIAFVESSFNLRAVSRVGASGVYQLMPFVARKMMIVSDEIDERRDPLKAGVGAAKVFAQNYQMLRHWPLAITGYNHGPFGIRRAVQQTKSTDIETIIEQYRGRAFGFASKNFYAEFLAMLWTLRHADRLFPEAELRAPLQFEVYTLKNRQRFLTVARYFELDPDDLAKLNPDILPSHVRRNGFLPRGYQIKLPKGSQVIADNWQHQAWQTVVMDSQQGPRQP